MDLWVECLNLVLSKVMQITSYCQSYWRDGRPPADPQLLIVFILSNLSPSRCKLSYLFSYIYPLPDGYLLNIYILDFILR